MGCTSSAPPRTHYCLTIGPAGAGKSSFVKQLALLYQGDTPQLEWKQVLQRNILYGLQEIPELINTEVLEEPENVEKEIEYFTSLEINKATFTKDLMKKARKLWVAVEDEYETKITTRYSEFAQALPYGMKHIDRLADSSTPPTQEDILMARQRTAGVTKSSFTIDGKPWEITDAGGQAVEQKKWMAQIQGAKDTLDFIVFFSPLDEYDAPKDKKNPKGIHEAFNVWKNTVNGDLIPANIPIVLLFNKLDLLKTKLERAKFSDYFKKFSGKNEPNAIVEYLREEFMKLVDNEARKKSIYVFSATAIDGESVKNAFAAARQQVVSNAISDTGL